jgi:hypothetical protein
MADIYDIDLLGEINCSSFNLYQKLGFPNRSDIFQHIAKNVMLSENGQGMTYRVHIRTSPLKYTNSQFHSIHRH